MGAATAVAAATAATGHPAAADGDACVVTPDTAFRQAERRYQLHFQQSMRYRQGRLRGGKLKQQPTDLSDLIDVRSLDTGSTAVVTAVSVCVSRSSSSSDDGGGNSDVQQAAHRALLFHRHPGLVVFPGALEPGQQLQLMAAALQQWPDPPARTNHTKAYSSTLCGLFQAAQQGLKLQDVQGEVAALHQQQLEPEPLQQQKPQQHQQQEQQQQQPPSPPPKQATAQQRCSCDGGPLPRCSCSSPWSADGAGPAAALLLRKLRWVCLGPPYNWTERVYEPHLPHRPLPQPLVDLARAYAAAAARATQQASDSCSATPTGGAAPTAAAGGQPSNGGSVGRSGGGGSDPASCSSRRPGAHGCGHNRDGGSNGPNRDGSSSGGSSSSSSSSACGYVPNVALVNFYHAGDTLSGHRDDVERDLTQPIVTMSLGCDAVFLMGGHTRDVPPTPLLLRSGDVLVLAQEARACYHGVPRVLTDRSLPPELLRAVEQSGDSSDGDALHAVLKHMQQCRINVSVRSTL